MSPYLFAVTVVIILAACVVQLGPKPPKVKTRAEIDAELNAEKIELHNVSRDYAQFQLREGLESYPRAFVDAMMSAAFRSGAMWQQRRDDQP